MREGIGRSELQSAVHLAVQIEAIPKTPLRVVDLSQRMSTDEEHQRLIVRIPSEWANKPGFMGDRSQGNEVEELSGNESLSYKVIFFGG